MKPLQVARDAFKFEVHNDDFPLFIMLTDVNEIISGQQCLKISILQF